MKYFCWACVGLLLITILGSYSYEYYMFVRTSICICSVLVAIDNYRLNGDNLSSDVWWFIGFALLFNPVIPVEFGSKAPWVMCDILVGWFFAGKALSIQNSTQEKSEHHNVSPVRITSPQIPKAEIGKNVAILGKVITCVVIIAIVVSVLFVFSTLKEKEVDQPKQIDAEQFSTKDDLNFDYFPGITSLELSNKTRQSLIKAGFDVKSWQKDLTESLKAGGLVKAKSVLMYAYTIDYIDGGSAALNWAESYNTIPLSKQEEYDRLKEEAQKELAPFYQDFDAHFNK